MSVNSSDFGFQTRSIHAGQEPDETGAVMPAIYLSTTFAQDGPGNHKGFEYSRSQNPTRKRLEENLSSLESGKHAFAFSSGCAATTAVAACLSQGDHVISVDDVYGGTFRIFDKVFRKFGIETDFVDLQNASALKDYLRPNTKLVWLETPTNPLLHILDIETLSEIAGRQEIPVLVDNTFATPYLQQPLKIGATLVLHSTTKYLGGHSDVLGGAIVTTNAEWAERIRFVQNALGGVPSPLDSFLVLRGIKTLGVRMERHSQNAMELADFLTASPQVIEVIYPGLNSHPQHSFFDRQMRLPGGMLAFKIAGGLTEANQFLKALSLVTCAESLGGVETLIGHPATMTHASIPKHSREKRGITDNLLRLSVGLEDVQDLKADLKQAFFYI
jgi:cystathionine gamma-lyase